MISSFKIKSINKKSIIINQKQTYVTLSCVTKCFLHYFACHIVGARTDLIRNTLIERAENFSLRRSAAIARLYICADHKTSKICGYYRA